MTPKRTETAIRADLRRGRVAIAGLILVLSATLFAIIAPNIWPDGPWSMLGYTLAVSACSVQFTNGLVKWGLPND